MASGHIHNERKCALRLEVIQHTVVCIYHTHKSMGVFWKSFLIGGRSQKGAEGRTRLQTCLEKLGLRNPLAMAQSRESQREFWEVNCFMRDKGD